jgi:2-keto-4-pentenoate hydratase/2-oxohepta-3-ene-1,7-dioic acid hydratase in catechol pathway
VKLCTVRAESSGAPRAGVAIGDEFAEIVVPRHLDGHPDPLRALIADGALAAPELGARIPLQEAVFAPPVRPDKFICIGLNYRSHAEEAGMEVTKVPTFFVKLPNAIRGHRDDIPMPTVSTRIDWEGELAVVIGSRAEKVTAEDAMSYVLGYTVHNDVTARDYQFKTSQWIVGKTFDGFAPFGPWIVTADEVGDPTDLRLVTTVNGEVMQDARTDDLIFSIPELIAFLSSFMTLEPGDVIATGTPAGIGAMMNPRRWLADGDEVAVTIDGVGTLTNRFVGPSGMPVRPR